MCLESTYSRFVNEININLAGWNIQSGIFPPPWIYRIVDDGMKVPSKYVLHRAYWVFFKKNYSKMKILQFASYSKSKI